jgi:hypothetical protein
MMFSNLFAPQSVIHSNGCTVTDNNLSEKDYKDYEDIESSMYPREDSKSTNDVGGFLNIGDKITDVIDSDQKLLEKLCVTRGELVSRLETVINTYEKINKLVNKYSDEKDRGVYNHNASEVFKFKIDDECVLIESNLIIKIVPPNKEIYMCPFMCNKSKHVNNYYRDHRCQSYGNASDQSYRDTGSDRRPNNKLFKDVIITNTDTHEVIRFNQILLHMIRSHRFFGGAMHRLDPMMILKIIGITPKCVDNLSRFENDDMMVRFQISNHNWF